MHMGIHQAGSGNHALRVYDLKHVLLFPGKNSSLCFRDRVCYFYNFFILYQDILIGIRT